MGQVAAPLKLKTLNDSPYILTDKYTPKPKLFFPIIFSLQLPEPKNPLEKFYYTIISKEIELSKCMLIDFMEITQSDTDAKRAVKEILYELKGYLNDISNKNTSVYNYLKLAILKTYFELYLEYSYILNNFQSEDFDDLYYSGYGEYPDTETKNAYNLCKLSADIQYSISLQSDIDVLKSILTDACSIYKTNSNCTNLKSLISGLVNTIIAYSIGFETDNPYKASNDVFQNYKAAVEAELYHADQSKHQHIIKEKIDLLNNITAGITLNDTSISLISEWLNTLLYEDTQKSSSTNKSKSDRKNVIFYRKMASNPENINDIYNSLCRFGFISSETELRNFKNLFSGKHVERSIIWLGTAMELHSLIRLIKIKNVLTSNAYIWDAFAEAIVKNDGTTFTKDDIRKTRDVTGERLNNIEKAVALL